MRADRAWTGGGNVQFPSDTLDESTYAAVSGGSVYRVIVSDGGRRVTVGNGATLSGSRTLAG